MKKLLVLAFTFVGMISCTLEQQIHFNKDWSGNSKFVIDYSMIKELTQDTTSGSDEMLQDSSIIKTSNTLKEVDGITNVKVYEDEDGQLVIAFDFKDIKTLNASMNQSNSTPGADIEHTFFLVAGKTITFSLPPLEPDSTEVENLKMMSEMLKYKLRISFDKKIKKLKANNGARVSDNNMFVTWEPKTMDLIKGDIDTKVEVTLK